MKSDSSWYARRFGGQPAPAQRPPPAYVPGGYQQNQQAIQLVAQRESLINQPPPKVTIDNLWGAMHTWRGGKAHKVDPDPCPECGSARYYSRTGEGVRRGPPPAPHCFDCGFNGMFQQGLPSSWQPG